MALALLTFAFVFICINGQSDCMWQDISTGQILNLNPLNGITLTNIDTGNDPENTHRYYFTPCQNGTYCNMDIMVRQEYADQNVSNGCWPIGRWDPNIRPSLDTSFGNDQWTFIYNNGDNDCGSPRRTWIPTFICDPTVNAVMGEIIETPSGSCTYRVSINTRYACQNFTTTTTQQPEGECLWDVGDNTLNLTSLDGLILNYADGQSLIWSVSPCTNSISCGNNGMGMSTVGTIGNCLQRLALWDQGLVDPTYSLNNGGQYEFVYQNGDNCPGEQASLTRIFYNCNPLEATGRITAAAQKSTCEYEIYIDSNLACQ